MTTWAAPLGGSSANMDIVCLNRNGYTDKTSQANDATTSDVTMAYGGLPTDPWAVFFGMDAPFSELVINVGTAGTGGTVDWAFGNGEWGLIDVVDETDHFRTAGTNSVSWDPPADWAPTEIEGASQCPGERYYVHVATGAQYTVAPLASQISAVTYNLRVRVTDELGNPLEGLTRNSFAAFMASDETIYGFRQVADGTYDLALAADTADTDYGLWVERDGFATIEEVPTGALDTSLTDLSPSPIALAYGFKVTSIHAEASTTPLTDVFVRAGDDYGTTCIEAAAAWYCPIPLDDSGLGVEIAKTGYVTDTSYAFTSDRVTHGDSQRVLAVTGLKPSVRVAVTGQTSLTGITWAKSVNGAAFETVTPASSNANVAYFALPPTYENVILRATKQGISGDTGAPFTPSSTQITERAVAITIPGYEPPVETTTTNTTQPIVPVTTQPTARAIAPGEAGPVFSVSWTSSNLRPEGRIEIWVVDGEGKPYLHHRSARGVGAIGFYGVANHTYGFYARPSEGHKPFDPAALSGVTPDVSTRITTDRLSPPSTALLGPSQGPIYAIDGNADGFPETFQDESGQWSIERIVGRDAGEPHMLLRSNLDPSMLYVWDLRANTLAPVIQETREASVSKRGGEIVAHVQLTDDGWVLSSTPDAAPGEDILRVLREDGSEVAHERVWRDGGRTYVLDNGTNDYEIVYQAPATRAARWILIASGGLAAAAVLFVAWVEWPSVQRLERRAGQAAGLGWALRHCRRCMAPLPRPQRFARGGHTCAVAHEKVAEPAVPRIEP